MEEVVAIMTKRKGYLIFTPPNGRPAVVIGEAEIDDETGVISSANKIKENEE